MQYANQQSPIGLRYRLCIWAFYASALFLTIFSHAADNKQQPEKVKQSIFSKEKTIQRQGQHTTSLNKLKQQEQSIVHSFRALQNTQRILKILKHSIGHAICSIRRLYNYQTTQQELMAQQLDTTFCQEQNPRLELVLKNKENMHGKHFLTYFSYLNEMRAKIINDLNQIYIDLLAKKREQQQKQQQRKTLQQQQQQRQILQRIHATYQKILSNLNLSISIAKGKHHLKELHRGEERLRNIVIHTKCEVREAQLIRKKEVQVKNYGNTYKQNVSERVLIAPDGLGHPSGQDIWPVRGRTLHSFGESQQGELRYKGLVIAAPKDSKVKAIAAGRVLMADWLQGYRMIIVIEHGKGDMSLYGYNQHTLVNVGDQVKAGQPIAIVGTNSNQKAPSLYFEIRRCGQAVNPIPWLER